MQRKLRGEAGLFPEGKPACLIEAKIHARSRRLLRANTAQKHPAYDGAEPAQITTKSGLQYVDIVPGKGPNPQTGYQVCRPRTHRLTQRDLICYGPMNAM